MKKIVMILIVVFNTIILFGCNNNNAYNKIIVVSGLDNTNPLVGNEYNDFPLVSQNESLNIMINGYENIKPENVYVWQKYQEMTGVKINWNVTTKSNRVEAVNSALINKTNLDLIIRCKISSDLITQYGENGLILDLSKDDLLKKYAPNCWNYLQSHVDALASVMNSDGSIYSLPQVNSGAELRVSRKIFINKNWLERLNLKLPQTTDDLYNILKAFKENDANGNGDKNDEIPLSSMDWGSIKEAFYGAFGLANRGLHNMIVDCDEETGKARFIETTNEYKSFIEYFNKLYSEKLIDEKFIKPIVEIWTEGIVKDKIGVFCATNLALIPADKVDNWIALENPLIGPDGYNLWTAIRANFHSSGAAVIPSTCKNPELVLKWLDYFWTDEGTLFYHMGIENETFIKKSDGTYDYMPYIYEKMINENKSFDDVIAQFSPYPGGSNPTVEIAPYFMGGETTLIPAKAAKSLINFGPKEYWPSFTFIGSDNSKKIVIQKDITKYTSDTLEKFIKGTKPLSEWDDYVKQIEYLKVDELLKIYNKVIEEYEMMFRKEVFK